MQQGHPVKWVEKQVLKISQNTQENIYGPPPFS